MSDRSMATSRLRRVSMFVLNDMRLDSRVRREASALAGAGYVVTVYAVLTQATAHLWREWVPDGYTIVRVPMLMPPVTESGAAFEGVRTGGAGRAFVAAAFAATRPLFGGALHFAANWQLRWARWSRRVVRLVEPADIWHAHDLNTLPLAIGCADRFGGSVVYDSHEVFTEAGATSRLPASARAFMRWRERRWAREASAIITVNDSVASVLRHHLDIPDITVVHNCANRPSSNRSPLRERIGVGPSTPVVLYHGSVTIGRGIEALVSAVEDRRLASPHLVVMGYGPRRPHIEKLARSSAAADRIHFLPPVPPTEVTTWVSGADVAAMPIEPTTLNHRLSSPNKLFEAIAAGVPVVGPDFPEFRRIVHDQRRGHLGRLHADHGPSAIAGAVGAILSLPPAERAALRTRCRAAAAERWNWDVEAQRLLSAYAMLSPSSMRFSERRPLGRSVMVRGTAPNAMFRRIDPGP
jgi:glycosyltransferase involved in cell wall biosynthesis